MGVPGNADLLLLKTAVAGGYTISRSLRFNSSDSAYCSRTFTSVGNRKKWTWAGWIKRATTNTFEIFFSSEVVSQNAFVGFGSSSYGNGDNLLIGLGDGSTDLLVYTTAVFRDPSAWYHIVISIDTDNATEANRCQIYINGTLQSRSGTVGSGRQPTINNNIGHSLGRNIAGAPYYFNGYLADIHFIDGQALDPSSFAETDATTGAWNPKAYSGSYGTNGFHLDFADNSNNTATTLGKDTSGNSNNWTPNNFYVSNTVYSSGVSITGSYANNTNARMAFDGSTSTKLEMSGSNNQITFTPPASISYSSTVEVYLTPTGNVTYTSYSFNGGADTAFSAGDGWKTVASGGGTFTSLVLKQGAQSNNIGFAAIRINGTTILVDASSVDNDSTVDSPSNGTASSGGDAGGVTVGNYATLNRLDTGGTSVPVPTDGNLKVTGFTDNSHIRSTIPITSGKFYWEVTALATTPNFHHGISTGSLVTLGANYLGGTSGTWGYFPSPYSNAGEWRNAGTNIYTDLPRAGTNDVLMFAVDASSGKIWVGLNGTWFKSGNPAGGTSPLSSNLPTDGTPIFPHLMQYDTTGSYINFGQRPFAYTAPSGFKALCTANLPTPTIAKGSDYMDVKLYTGNGSTQTISGLNFSPDLVWIKPRSAAYDHIAYDTIRGALKALFPNLTNAENTNFANSLTAFNSDGYTLGNEAQVNQSGVTFASWCWDAGSSTSTISANAYSAGVPSITSSVRANTSAGFSVITATTTNTSTQTFGHGLNVAPAFHIIKLRNGTDEWYVYHSSIGATKYLRLNSTAAQTTSSALYNDTAPTSSLITLGSGWNSTSYNIVCYAFAPVSGYSAMGSYVGNGSSDGPFVYTGHRSRFLMVKRTDASGDWYIVDTARSTSGGANVVDQKLYPNLSAAENGGSGETTSTNNFDILSNGFKCRTTNGNTNASGGTYIYFAVAESPFAYARAR